MVIIFPVPSSSYKRSVEFLWDFLGFRSIVLLRRPRCCVRDHQGPLAANRARHGLRGMSRTTKKIEPQRHVHQKATDLCWLVVSNMTFIFHNIWDVILPIDELIFFKMVIHQPVMDVSGFFHPNDWVIFRCFHPKSYWSLVLLMEKSTDPYPYPWFYMHIHEVFWCLFTAQLISRHRLNPNVSQLGQSSWSRRVNQKRNVEFRQKKPWPRSSRISWDYPAW